MRAKVVIDVPDVVIPGVDVETLINVEIVVVTVAAINLEFVVKVPTAVEVLAVVWTGATVGGATGIGVEMNATLDR